MPHRDLGPPIRVVGDRCPSCGNVKLRPGDGERRHGSNASSPWTCIICGYRWVDKEKSEEKDGI
jgi:rubrerythrin